MDAQLIRIRADKTGAPPLPGQAWPAKGIEFPHGIPVVLTLPISFLRRHMGATWLQLEGIRKVERPSQPSPDVDERGSTAVSAEHLLAEVPPHTFLHINRIVFDLADGGQAAYAVTVQPDKYVDPGDGDLDVEAQVTPEIYDAGQTHVEHAYTCTLEG